MKLLNKPYVPDEMIQKRFGRYGLVFKTDKHGRPALLFIGKADADGNINGERFARRLQTDRDGRITKDH